MASMLRNENEEESFVILGSSPPESVRRNVDDDVIPNVESISETPTPALSFNASQIAIPNKNQEEKSAEDSSSASKIANGVEENSQKAQPAAKAAGDSSLAVSFLLGNIDADELKLSVYSQFPSLCSTTACLEDIEKLQHYMSMYGELKKTLLQNNYNMKVFLKEHETSKLRDAKNQFDIAQLRNENIELRKEMQSNKELLQLTTDLQKKENEALVKMMSAKTAQIDNMTQQIDNLELQQLASFECLSINGEKEKKLTATYINRAEHDVAVKESERKLSELLAKNLDLQDVQTQYVDEINYLKVNLTAAEELIKQLRVDITELQSSSGRHSEYAANQAEIALLRQQIEIYSNDFTMERTARENLTGEKDQLLQDLRAIQRKNQELTERVVMLEMHQQSASQIRATTAAITRSTLDPSAKQRPIRPLPRNEHENNNSCPVCWSTFTSLDVLVRHVDTCLKGN